MSRYVCGAQLILDRQLPDSLANRGKDRVGERRRRADRPGLADVALRFGAMHQINLDRWHLVNSFDVRASFLR
jgi:hypothetical protein